MGIDEIENKGVKICLEGKALSGGSTTSAIPSNVKLDTTDNSQMGVRTKNAHWYALRTAYGREKKAYEYIINNNGTAFYPTIIVDKLVKGRIKSIEVSRIPNIFFAFGTEEEIRHFVYDNVHLPFLRFYYRYYNKENGIANEPLIVPDRQIESLRIVCSAEEDTIVTAGTISKFLMGQTVRVTSGPFAGVVGKVARFQGQQRVGVIVGDIVTAVTAYIPTGMMEFI